MGESRKPKNQKTEISAFPKPENRFLVFATAGTSESYSKKPKNRSCSFSKTQNSPNQKTENLVFRKPKIQKTKKPKNWFGEIQKSKFPNGFSVFPKTRKPKNRFFGFPKTEKPVWGCTLGFYQ